MGKGGNRRQETKREWAKAGKAGSQDLKKNELNKKKIQKGRK